jgi:2-polyprenyl-3-methyl-5-hydroxy-6-metoxy-1,4-benzoquinol methylase
VIPLAAGANLDVIGREVAFATADSFQVAFGHDASSGGRESRAEHVQHLDELALMADRAANIGGCATFAGVTHQLGLSVTHLGPSCFTRLIGHDRALASETVVDRTARTVRASLGDPLPHELTKIEGLMWSPYRETTVALMQNWTRYTTAGDYGQRRPTQTVELGPGDVDGLDRRLIGDVSGMRILDLGCGAGHSAVALAHQGARVVAIDPDETQVTLARSTSERAEVHVEVHHADLADLAFLQADIFDAVIAVHSLAGVSDIGRVFRQTHRLLKTDRPLIVSLPHPAGLMVNAESPRTIATDYDDSAALGEGHYLTHRHGIGHIFTQLNRANYRVDTLIEPKGNDPHPASVIFRARKIGN